MESFNLRKRRQDLEKARTARSRVAAFRLLRTGLFVVAAVTVAGTTVSSIVGIFPIEGTVAIVFGVAFLILLPAFGLTGWITENFHPDIYYKHAVEDAEADYLNALQKEIG